MLSALQRRVAALLRGLPEASDFALAVGAALMVHGAIDRLTRDLDFFAVDPGAVDQLLPVFVAAARAAGMTVSEERIAPGFARLLLADDTDQTRVDLAADARLLPTEQCELGLVLSAEELAVDKVLAIFGRAEARDFVDLAVLEPRFGLDDLCTLAAFKDTGSRRPGFLSMLTRFTRLQRDEFEIDEEGYRRTVESVERWRRTVSDKPSFSSFLAQNAAVA